MQKSMAEQWLEANPWAVPAAGARPANAAYKVVEAASDWIAKSLGVPAQDPVHFAFLDLVTIALKRWEIDGIDPFTLYNVAPGPASEGAPADGPGDQEGYLAGEAGPAESAGLSPGVSAGLDDGAGADEVAVADDPSSEF